MIDEVLVCGRKYRMRRPTDEQGVVSFEPFFPGPAGLEFVDTPEGGAVPKPTSFGDLLRSVIIVDDGPRLTPEAKRLIEAACWFSDEVEKTMKSGAAYVSEAPLVKAVRAYRAILEPPKPQPQPRFYVGEGLCVDRVYDRTKSPGKRGVAEFQSPEQALICAEALNRALGPRPAGVEAASAVRSIMDEDSRPA